MIKNNNLIEVNTITKRYGKFSAVKNISFELAKGDVLGFLGPNGAGKSTAMQMLSGNLKPDQGDILIKGVNLYQQSVEAKINLGYLAENPPLYREMTVDEYLYYCGRLRQIKKKHLDKAMFQVKNDCGLALQSKKRIGLLSKGFQQRVGIAQAIIHQPDVIILDEPTDGLDPRQMVEIRSLIKNLQKKSGIIFSTHILSEVQAICNRVLIINQGQQVHYGDMSELQQDNQLKEMVIGFRNPPDIKVLLKLSGVTKVEQLPANRFKIGCDQQQNPVENIVRQSVQQDWGLCALIPYQHSLENIFIDLVNQEQPSC